MRLWAIREAGLQVPDDISVIGFDDSELASVADVPLTSMSHPKYQIGKWATEFLFEKIQHKGPNPPVKQMIINPTIVLRNSVTAIEYFCPFGTKILLKT